MLIGEERVSSSVMKVNLSPRQTKIAALLIAKAYDVSDEGWVYTGTIVNGRAASRVELFALGSKLGDRVEMVETLDKYETRGRFGRGHVKQHSYAGYKIRITQANADAMVARKETV